MNVGLINIYDFETFFGALKTYRDTAYFPLRTIVVYENRKEEVVNKIIDVVSKDIKDRDTLKDWIEERFVFVEREKIKDLEEKNIWKIWKEEFLKKKGISKINFNINLGGGDSKGSLEKELESLKEKIAKDFRREIFIKVFSECIREDCKEENFKKMMKKVVEMVLKRGLYNPESKNGEFDLHKKGQIIGINEGKELNLYIYRHTRYSEQREIIKEPFIYITISGMMIGFNAFKDIDLSEEGLFKVIEKLLYRILIVDERVLKYVIEHNNLENLYHSGISLGVIETQEKDKFTCFNDEKLIEKIKDKENTRFLTFLKVYPGGILEINPKEKYDIAIIHISCLEKIAESMKYNKESFIQRFVDELIKNAQNVYLTTGRGRINVGRIKHVGFVPFSIINASLYNGFIDKILLVDSISFAVGGLL